MRDERLAQTFIFGTAASILASVITALIQTPSIVPGLILSVGLLLLLGQWVYVRNRFRALKRLGVVDWDEAMSTGHTTADCMKQSHKSLRFVGMASTKWLNEPFLLRKMLQRHAGNGGQAEFLLLDPDSEACRRFEQRKNVPAGSVAKTIRDNVVALLALKDENLPIEIRLYSAEPRFRIVVIDDRTIVLGMYSYTTQSGDDTPQLVLDCERRPWSFYYAINAYARQLWSEGRAVLSVREAPIRPALGSGSHGNRVWNLLDEHPRHFSDELIAAYADWCRARPASFAVTEPRSEPGPELPSTVREYIGAVGEVIAQDKHDFRRCLVDLLVSDYGLILLWCLHELPSPEHERLLYEYLPFLRPLEEIRRGGVNLFKRYSWTVHLLAVCRFLWDDLPRGSFPPTRHWSPEFKTPLQFLQREYQRLSPDEVRFLRCATLLHDIGVRDGVAEHDRHGIAYVDEAIRAFGGPLQLSRVIDSLAATELPLALRAFVGEHTLASKFNAEEGPQRLHERVSYWTEQAHGRPQLNVFFQHSFPRMISLFFVCDLFGVSDELISSTSLRRAYTSIDVISRITRSEPLAPPSQEQRTERIGTLIGIDDHEAVLRIMSQLASGMSDELIQLVTAAEQLDYAVGVLTPLKDPSGAISILVALADIWRAEGPGAGMRVSFSPHCATDALGRWGQALASTEARGKQPPKSLAEAYGVRIEWHAVNGERSIRVSTDHSQA